MNNLLVALAGICMILAATIGTVQASEECRGHKDECVNLTGAEIVYENLGRLDMSRMCGSMDAEACATLNVTTQECTIYYQGRYGIDAKTDLHERNHCYGWAHNSEHAKSHKQEWLPMQELTQ